MGSHVCNVGYIVKGDYRGRGIGRAMCEHSLKAAGALGYQAMQYNLVATTNTNAVSLWLSCGFQIAGTLPKAFIHSKQGLVDAYVIYQWLSRS